METFQRYESSPDRELLGNIINNESDTIANLFEGTPETRYVTAAVEAASNTISNMSNDEINKSIEVLGAVPFVRAQIVEALGRSVPSLEVFDRLDQRLSASYRSVPDGVWINARASIKS